jgi:hypothetical protein
MFTQLPRIAMVFAGIFILLIIVMNYCLDRPPGFALNQAANHFYRKSSGPPKQLAGLLISSGIADDWSQPESAYPSGTQRRTPIFTARADVAFPYQTYTNGLLPQGLEPGGFFPSAGSRYVGVSNVAELSAAIHAAQPGDIITLETGVYDISARSIPVRAPGQPEHPVYVRARQFGSVQLNMNTLEGFHVMAPYWVFENLSIRGTCKSDRNCEHAFHVVGKGHSFTLRNSEITDFNAPIKVNFQRHKDQPYYPDYGLLEYNNFYNNRPRSTGNSVTLLNIDSADSWVVRGNYIADFAKSGSDRISYGAFIKGNSRLGTFERNLVICEHQLLADEGVRIGLSFGGGGSATAICKQQNCTTEHTGGIMRNNIILNCSRDVGIYLNRAAGTQVYHNLLYNSLGIDSRFPTSSAYISNNIISGRVRNRDGGSSRLSGNVIVRGCIGPSLADCDLTTFYQAAKIGDLRLKRLEHGILEPVPNSLEITQDFCGSRVSGDVVVGPIQYQHGLSCLHATAGTIDN